MKRLLFCLFVLISAAANVMACPIKKAVKEGDVVTFIGTIGWAGEPCYEPYDMCAECAVPVIVYKGVTYFVNEGKTDWETYLVEQGYRGGEEVTVTGVFSEDCCYHFIDLVSVHKSGMGIEESAFVPVGLDIHQPMYNMLGVLVDENYRGVVIQNGTKYIR